MRSVLLSVLAWFLVTQALAASQRPAAVSSVPLIVFAAASMTDALEEVDHAFTARRGIGVKASYAASSTLARQVEAGASADAVLWADSQWMDYLQQRGLIAAQSRRDLLGNSLVLIAPAARDIRLTIAPHFNLEQALAGDRLALADPDSVPAGRYARAALSQLGAWDSVASRLLPAENVRAALMYVARGEAALGIVYGTDARAQPQVHVVDTFPSDSHAPIVYPVALTMTARPQAREWLQFMCGDEAGGIFERYGFRRLPQR